MYAPARVVEMAAARGLAAVALTDHDTTAGLAAARAAAAASGLEFVDGIELSTDHPRGTLHILGYGFDATCPALQDALAMQRDRRRQRVESILEKLRGAGVSLVMADLASPDGDEAALCRPHIATALVRLGVVDSFEQAFSRYLGRGGIAYVAPVGFAPNAAIDLVCRAGGVAVLAHPMQLACGSDLERATLIRGLVDAGLAGIEVFHPDHDARSEQMLGELARRMGLVVTGGTDFHALGGRAVRGVGFGRVRVPYGCLAALRAHLRG